MEAQDNGKKNPVWIPGYRFCPRDDELLYYLGKKATNPRYTTRFIKEIQLYNFHPQELREIYGATGDEFSYFFTLIKRTSQQGYRCSRGAKGGYWKATGGDKSITGSKFNDVAVKKALVFYDGESGHGKKTSWIMHELKIIQHHGTTPMKVDEYALCRIYKRATNKALQQNAEELSVVEVQQVEGEGGSRKDNVGLEDDESPSINDDITRFMDGRCDEVLGQKFPNLHQPLLPLDAFWAT